MSTVSATINLSAVISEVLAAVARTGDLSLVPSTLNNRRFSFSSGSGYTQKAYRDLRVNVASSQTLDYDLIGTLTDADGATINFDVVQALIVVNNSASGSLEIGPKSGGTGWLGLWKNAADRSYLPAGAVAIYLLSTAGVAASAGTDVFQVSTPGIGSGYGWDLIIIGKDNI